MRALIGKVGICGLVCLASAASVSAQTTPTEGDYPVLKRGRVVVVNAQRLVVTQEPLPVAESSEAPPGSAAVESKRPAPPSPGAIWVAGHWGYGATGFVWIAGRYVASRPGHVFVPPRWAELDEQYLYFTGFYVPYGVYVRSHFNRYYYSGTPKTGFRSVHGPYWPVGAPTRANRPLTSASARDPYWPIGAP